MSIDDQCCMQEHAQVDKLPDVDTEKVKDAVTKDLTFASQMDVKEYTLWQKCVKYKISFLLSM